MSRKVLRTSLARDYAKSARRQKNAAHLRGSPIDIAMLSVAVTLALFDQCAILCVYLRTASTPLWKVETCELPYSRARAAQVPVFHTKK